MSRSPRDSGVTLIELLVTMALMGIMMAIAVTGWSSWARTSAHSGAAQQLVTVVRQAQQRAVTEGQPLCVRFTTGSSSSYEVDGGACASLPPTRVISREQLPGQMQLVDPSFTKPGTPNLTGQTSVQFSPRGSGWPGSVSVVRQGSSTTYTLSVEVLTGHVALQQS